MVYTYVIRSKKDGRWYTGAARDLRKRFKQHRILDECEEVFYYKSMTTVIIPKRMHNVVRREVIDVVREVLSDPDLGLELSPKFSRRLKKSIKEKKAGKVSLLSKIFAQYGI